MKKILILLMALILILPVTIGLLSHKSPIMLPESSNLKKISYLETATNSIKDCALEEYLVGVLAAEMPAEYHIEALKAQAVAARSFIISRMDKQNSDHPEAIVCDNPDHCKAHLDKKLAKKKWAKENADEYWRKLESAVTDTCGEHMICGGEVVEAFFFARSDGRTENSEDVWGEERPYLKSVESVWDKTHPEFLSNAEFKTSDARTRLNKLNADFSKGNNPLKVGKITHTTGGGVAEIEFDGITFRGKDIRSAFGLKSASFDVNANADTLSFAVMGYGHGVGMSQYGANCMAENGKNYTEILSHYYSNIQIIVV